jgi:uncharacterized phage-associated protein
VNETKYIAALEYLLDDETGANNQFMGKVKLMKLLYFADFDHYFQHGRSITGDSYIRLDFGPVPQAASRILWNLKSQHESLDIDREPGGRWHYRLRRRVSNGDLEPDELETLRSVVTRWRNQSTAEIVTASHGDPPWLMVKYGEPIPYHLVYYRRHVAPVNDEEPPTSLIEPSG